MHLRIVALAGTLALAGCGGFDESYPVMTFEPSGHAFDVTGAIDALTIEDLQDALNDNPKIKTLRMVDVPGSVDDENSLLQLTEFMQKNALNTVVPSYGMVSSGGTDLTLMGKVRVIEPGACIGIHSWAVDEPIDGETDGSKLPRAHPVHQLYLSFYKKIGISPDFYWLTQEAAGPDGMHWMSPQEINAFHLSSVPVSEDTSETDAERQRRCDARADAGPA